MAWIVQLVCSPYRYDKEDGLIDLNKVESVGLTAVVTVLYGGLALFSLQGKNEGPAQTISNLIVFVLVIVSLCFLFCLAFLKIPKVRDRFAKCQHKYRTWRGKENDHGQAHKDVTKDSLRGLELGVINPYAERKHGSDHVRQASESGHSISSGNAGKEEDGDGERRK